MPHPGNNPSTLRVPWLRLATLLLACGLQLAAPAQEINPPLGPYTNLRPEHFADALSYAPTNRIITTPFFYWYDAPTGAHLLNADGSDALTDHPASTNDFTYHSVDWHAQELSDMEDAGIDVVLPVYWGEPSQRQPGKPVSAQPWSYAGLPPLVAARERLLRAGHHPPRIGMFYDTSTLQFNNANTPIDLTAPYGRQWFYESIRDFFSLIPPKHWAMIDDQPIVFLYSAAFATDHDQACFEYLADAFADDFGGRRPWVVREISWNISSPQVYAWGGALGLKNPGVASLGPGYDHTAVPGREPLIVDREAGAFFSRNWNRFLQKPSDMVMIETWNEFHEGTDIADSLEYGRDYITLNRQFAELFHQGIIPPPILGPFSDFSQVSVRLGTTNEPAGLQQVESADGITAPAVAAGEPCRVTVPTQHTGRYVYFRVDDSFKWADRMQVEVEVDYFDAASGLFTLEFDGSDTNAPLNGAYTPVRHQVSLGGSRQWKRATFQLEGARFLNSQNGGTDFRISTTNELHLRQVEVRRFGVPAESGSNVQGVQDNFSLSSDRWVFPNGDPTGSQVANKMFSVPAGQRCLLQTTSLNSGVQGVLARLRVPHQPAADAASGGIVVGADPVTGQGIALVLNTDPTGGTSAQLLDEISGSSIVNAHEWQPNTWLWLRLSCQPDLSRVVARLWAADGETPEPLDWSLTLPLAPSAVPANGWPGLLGPSAARATVECDFFLFLSDTANETVVRLPALKLPRARLQVIARPPLQAELLLTGAPRSTYFLETSSNLLEWTLIPVTTDAVGHALLQLSPTHPHPLMVYRASHSN
ncbi:MAG: hypothetical protein RI897_80 [Verrucomicrobiota bacterium]|jgi:hypothetical protein